MTRGETGDWRSLSTVLGSLPVLLWSTNEQLRIVAVDDTPFRHRSGWSSPRLGDALFDWLGVADTSAEIAKAHSLAIRGVVSSFRFETCGESFLGWVRPRHEKSRLFGTLAVAVSIGSTPDEDSHDSDETTYATNPATHLLPWQKIVEAAVDFVLLLDPDGKILEVNRTNDGNKSRILGCNLLTMLPEACRGPLRSTLDRVMETGITDVLEFAVPGRLNDTKWFSARVARLSRANGSHALVMAATDVTKRKRTEQKLSAEEAMLRRLLDVQDRERRIIAYDIHDGFVQDVVGAQMILGTAIDGLPASSTRLRELLKESSDCLGRAINEGRRLISELRPMIIDEMGIVEAISYLANEEEARGGMHVKFTPRVRFQRLEPLLEGTIFRIVQEALVNARRHGAARNASIRLTQVDDAHVVLEVQDDGSGFRLEDVPADRYGLEGMRERARAFGGGATIETAPGQGTRITVKLPLSTPEAPRPANRL